MRRLRIGYVIIDCDGRDGTSVAMEHVMHRLARKGHDVHLFADVARGADLGLVKWHRVRALSDPSVARFASFFWNCSRRINKLPQTERFDILHSAGCNTVGANVYQVQNIQPAKRAILEQHGAFKGGGLARSLARQTYYAVTTRAERKVYRETKRPDTGGKGDRVRFLPVSNGVSRELQRHYGIGESSIDVVPNGVDLVRFDPANRSVKRGPVRAMIGANENELVLLFTGGEWERKGLRHAIAALPLIRTPHHAGGVRLVVAGRDVAMSEYETLATEHGVRERVSFIGFTDKPEDVMAAADVFVFPTYYEAFSLATLEAAAAGLPIVAAVTNGTEELIRPLGIPVNTIGENGALVDRDPQAIATVVTELASQPELLASAGRRAREIVEAEYSWDTISERVERVYYDIVERSNPMMAT